MCVQLDSQANRLWTECSLQRYDFERPWENAVKARRVTRKALLALYDAHLAEGGPQVRRLSTHIFSQRMAPPTLVKQPIGDDFYAQTSDMLAARDIRR
jgi:secreted Zn-dependent insulinase-like peptidase